MNHMKAGIAVVTVALLITVNAKAAVIREGNPFTPAGANYNISALQGINTANPLGQSGFSPQVNANFEFQGSTGVSYQDSNGQLKDFGLGLYKNSSNSVFSTGLKISYNSMVAASSVNITVEDFDISSLTSGFKVDKVSPSILLLGANNAILASANPAAILAALTPHTGNQSDDIWDLNLGAIAGGLQAPIAGFVLFADSLNGEQPSDPYLLINVGNGIPQVPEPANFIAGIAAIAFGGLFQVRQLRKARASK